MTLGYYSTQSLNPYKTKSKTNGLLASLLYDGLFKIDSSYNVGANIASSFVNDEKSVTVTVKNDVAFTDSSFVTAEDVAYSFSAAKKSPLYAQKLANFKSAVAVGEDVVFRLKNSNIYAVNCLTFPIVKSPTSNDAVPVGSGRFYLEKKSGSYALLKNEAYSGDEIVELEKIGLYDISKAENELYLLQIGDLSFSFDDHAKDDSKLKISADTLSVGLNNLVFIGLNSQSEKLAEKSVKSALCLALDLTTICSKSYGSLGRVCPNVFNPSWSVLSSAKNDVASFDTTEANSELEKAGYVYAYDTSTLRSKDLSVLELDLIVSKSDSRKLKAAKEIKAELEKVGIGIKLEELESNDFRSRLQSGDFDLYIGETKITDDMNLYPFFKSGGAVSCGIDEKSTVCDAYSDFACGKIDISTFISVFNEDKPFIPLCYRNATAYYSRELRFDSQISENDLFANLYSWEV